MSSGTAAAAAGFLDVARADDIAPLRRPAGGKLSPDGADGETPVVDRRRWTGFDDLAGLERIAIGAGCGGGGGGGGERGDDGGSSGMLCASESGASEHSAETWEGGAEAG